MTEGHSFTFPDESRGELDKALDELMSRARDVLTTQGRLRALLRANSAIIEHLNLPIVLERIVSAAVELVGAQYGALGVVAPDGTLEQFINVGMTPEQVRLIGHLPEGHGLLGALIEDPHPIRLPLLADDPRAVGFPAQHPPMSSFLGVPIRVRDEVYGNLYLSNQASGEFSDEDEQLVVALAATAGIAIENARLFAETRRVGVELAAARVDQQRMALLEDRGRIARDLHDHVIQQLFATGLELQSIAGSAPAALAERIGQSVANLDASISQIRTIIFALSPPSEMQPTVRHTIIDLANELAPNLARTPSVSFSGPVDLVITDELADDVMAVTREALANVVRHAHAENSSVDLAVDNGSVVLTIVDDGLGARGNTRRSGVANLEQRALDRGGAFSFDSDDDGTRLRWSVPVGSGTGT